MIEPYEIATAAARLLSDGENPEYDRALTELVCDTIGIHMDDKERVLETLRNMKGTVL